MRASAIAPILVRHWFLLLLPLLASASFAFAASVDWQRDGRIAELVLLFDAFVSLPILYFLCYRLTLTGRQMALRLIAIACCGLSYGTWLVPDNAEAMVEQVAWLRTAGITLLVIVELFLIAAAIQIAFSGKATVNELSAASGAPPWVARLMLLEARFWRWLWRSIRGR